MKELLSIEEKAHRYDKALRVVEKLHSSWKETQNRAADEIEEAFPELGESEDEKMINFISNELMCLRALESNGGGKGSDRYEELTKGIAWLEKQGEQTTDKIIEKARTEKQKVLLTETNGDAHIDWDCRNLQDVKLLLKYGLEYIDAQLEKQGERDEECKEINLVETLKHYPRETELYSPLYGKLWLAEVDEEHEIITCYRYPLDEGCTRAILEQEDTVSFYSDGTTGLPDYTVSKDCMLFLYNKQDKQKSVCSKENSCYYDDICEILINLINSPKSKVNKDVVQEDLDWLMSVWESLKSPWGEEDEKMLDKLIKHFDWESGYYFSKNDCDKAQEWLKSLRPQNSITDEELAKAKKQAYNDALDKIEYHRGEPTFDDGWSAAIWYLKNKNIQFSSTWKPTEEQMSCLAYTIDKDDCYGKDYTILKSLYDTLKELV